MTLAELEEHIGACNQPGLPENLLEMCEVHARVRWLELAQRLAVRPISLPVEAGHDC